MGRKKVLAANQAQESLELKPFCYYCDREFDSIKTLIQHQRTKHFNCAECGLKFDTVTGLRVHMLNAYKKTMKEVPNSIPGRENPDIVVHGMEGLPKGIIEEKSRKAMAERAERDKAKEEDARHRDKAAAAAPPPPASAPREEAAPPRPQPSKGKDEQPAAPEPMPAVPAPLPTQVALPMPELRQVEVPAASQLPQAMMPGLSPAVAKLLSGDSSSGPVISGGMTFVDSLPGYVVPSALEKLHPVALQVLAAAGALTPAKPPAACSTMMPPARGPLGTQLPPISVPGAAALGSPAPTALGTRTAGLPQRPMAAGTPALGSNSFGVGAMGPMGVVGNVAPPLHALGEPDEKRLRLTPPV